MTKNYRKRCRDCRKMFNSPNTYYNRCPKCNTKYIKNISKFGK